MAATHVRPHATDEDRARYRRRDHANIEAMQNLVIAEIAQRAADAYSAAQPQDETPPDFTMLANVRHLVSALQGAHGGGAVAFEEFTRDYLTIGKQLQYTGTEIAIRARVRRSVDDLLAWQRLVGYELFAVVKGGAIIAHAPDGTPIRKGSTFIDNLKPHADAAVLRARVSEEWKTHPGRALVAQVAPMLEALPKLKVEAAPVKQSTPKPLDQYEQESEAAVERMVEARADKIEQRGGDADLWLEKLELKISRMRQSRKRTERARRDHAALSIFDDESRPTPTDSSAEAPTDGEPESAGLCNKNVTQVNSESAPAQEVTESPIREIADFERVSMLEAALFWLSQGLRLFPLHSVFDGICTCPLGSECKNAGKHPLTRHGLKDATTDERQIRLWWTEHPHANIGAAMGGELRLFAVDSDPRHGGDASLYDLTEVHGLEWLNTLNIGTGSNGDHFWLHYPEDVEIRNSSNRLGPGLDIRGEGGYVVLPPSLHASGRRYRLKNTTMTQPAPAWLIEALTRTPDEQPAVVVDFQERKDRKVSGGIIPEGERNETVFRVGCAIWGKGDAVDLVDLAAQLRDVNAQRCSPPLADAEIAQIAASITRYPRGVPIQEGAA
jgi:hypothetical protein